MQQFAITSFTPEPFAYVRLTARLSDISTTMQEGFASLGARFAAAKVPMGGPPLAHFIGVDEHSTVVEIGFPVRRDDLPALIGAGLAIGESPRGDAMVATHIGPYEKAPETYDAMLAEMKNRGLEAASDMWERYFSPPGTPPEEIRTEVIWPVRSGNH